MLTSLKNLQDKLFIHQQLINFYKNYSIHQVISFLNNKSKKQQTKQRIKYLLSKTSSYTPEYKIFLYAPMTQKLQQKKQFIKYLQSQNSQEYFNMLIKKQNDIIEIIKSQPEMITVLFGLVKYQYGIKMIKLFKKLYEMYANKEKFLFDQRIKVELANGIGLENCDVSQGFKEAVDTIVQMRYAEIIVNIGILGGQCFTFIQPLITKVLQLYKTQDLLLKINLVQIISLLGLGLQTSSLLKTHPIWQYIQKDITNKQQDFYIQKYLLILLVEMWNQGKYQVTFKVQKQFEEFLKKNIMNKGEYLQAAVDLITSLFKEYQGVKMVVKSSEIFNKYIALSRSTDNSLKQPYLDSLISLTSIKNDKSTTKPQKKRSIINILNCIGNPSLCLSLSQNIDSDTTMIQGLSKFTQWFTGYLLLPFQQLQLKLTNIFINLLQFREICEFLFQNQSTTSYLLQPLNQNNSDKILRERKKQLIYQILQKGKTQWKGHQLEEYCRMLEKQIKHVKIDVQYALDVQ